MKWQRPTTWSAETVDGEFYAERFRYGVWSLWQREGNKSVCEGYFKTLRDAQRHADMLVRRRDQYEGHLGGKNV